MVSLYFFPKKQIKDKKIKEKSLPESILHIPYFKFLSYILHKGTPRCTRLSAVFTLEAAIILPLMASFFVSLLFFFRVMQVQLEVQKALDDTGRQLAVYLTGEGGDSAGEHIAAEALFLKEMADRKEAGQYITGGSFGISLMESEFLEDEIHLKARYHIRLPIRIFWLWDFSMAQKADCRKWTGFRGTGEGNEADEWVYITETGTVYHTTSTCTYLNLSIQSVDYEQVSAMRNEEGGKYYACELCVKDGDAGGHVYITNQGNRYHSDLNCSGIRRTVYMVRLSEVGSRNKCSRCGAQGG